VLLSGDRGCNAVSEGVFDILDGCSGTVRAAPGEFPVQFEFCRWSDRLRARPD
jgi:hypothetical protein